MTRTLWVCTIGAVAANVWLLAQVIIDGGWDGVWIWFMSCFGVPGLLWGLGYLIFATKGATDGEPRSH